MDKDKYVIATYCFQTKGKPEEALERLALQQTTSWWQGWKQKAAGYAAQVSELNCNFSEGLYQGTAKVAFPLTNLEEGVTLLYNVIIGKIHFMKHFSAIKLIEIDLPESYLRNRGPKKGLLWLQERFGIKDRPLFINPIKPGAGLPIKDFAELCYEALVGGMDLVKDDEVIVNPSYCPIKKRVQAVMKAVKKVEDLAGEKKGYILNISGSAARIDYYYELAINEGVSGIMVCPGVNSIDIAEKFGQHPETFVTAHCTMLYAQSNQLCHGIKASVMSKLQRIAGVDLLIMPFKGGDYDYLDDQEHQDNFEAVAGSWTTMKPAMPSVAGGQNVKTLLESYRFIGNPNYAFVAGSFVNSHPSGSRAGAQALRQAWEAISKGISLEDYADSSPELANALQQVK